MARLLRNRRMAIQTSSRLLQSLAIQRLLLRSGAATTKQTDNRASLPVHRVRMDVAYFRIRAVYHRATLTLGHGLHSVRRRGDLCRAGYQRIGAKSFVAVRVAVCLGEPGSPLGGGNRSTPIESKLILDH